MARRKFLKPALGQDGIPLIVRDPNGLLEPLPAEGKEVEMNKYWDRRLVAGDVIEVMNPPSSEE